MFRSSRLLCCAAALLLVMQSSGSGSVAAETVIVKVNDNTITELDVQLAAAEIGNDLGSLPTPTRRRVLVEYLIENELMAAAAVQAGLGTAAKSDQRTRYWQRRGLRESYFYNHITGTVSQTDARRYYDQHIASQPPEKEVKARHILLKSKDHAVEIYEKLAHGADFEKMAAEFSADPGTKMQGGMLGFFGQGRMVPQFEAAAFKLSVGEVSDPVETQFGWHLIKVDEVRTREIPKLQDVQEHILLSLIHEKTKQITVELRSKARIEYVDVALRTAIEAEQGNPKTDPGR